MWPYPSSGQGVCYCSQYKYLASVLTCMKPRDSVRHNRMHITLSAFTLCMCVCVCMIKLFCLELGFKLISNILIQLFPVTRERFCICELVW